MSGQHWLAIYISKHGVGSFFDSFGNSPVYIHFPKSIAVFLKRNCVSMQHSSKQVHDVCSAVCGQHCVFFLYHMDKGLSYDDLLLKYSDNLSDNDFMVCKFVKKLRPSVACSKSGFDCIQCVHAGDLFLNRMM